MFYKKKYVLEYELLSPLLCLLFGELHYQVLKKFLPLQFYHDKYLIFLFFRLSNRNSFESAVKRWVLICTFIFNFGFKNLNKKRAERYKITLEKIIFLIFYDKNFIKFYLKEVYIFYLPLFNDSKHLDRHN